MSKIEWTDKTWNPITGCTKISEGCANCYAEKMAKRLKGRYGYPADDPFKVTFHKDKIDQPLKWKKPSRIFVCSMGDLFHDDVRFDEIHEIWDTMKACPQHTFIVLTKRPERMKKVVGRIYQLERFGAALGFWRHVWLGVTAENQERAAERIPILLQIPAAVRFVSIEPMLGPIDFYGSRLDWIAPFKEYDPMYRPTPRIDWIICGAESGQKARLTRIEWIRELRDQCVVEEVPFFLKQMDTDGTLVKMPELDGQVWDQYPERNF